MNSLSPKDVITKLEESLLLLAEEYKGDGAFYFYNEDDVKCRLYATIQKKLKDPEIVHAEWGGVNPRGRYDIAIWRPSKKKEAFKYWGKNLKTVMEKVPKLILAAVEIDCLYGGCGKAKNFITYKDLENNRDIQKLERNIGKLFPFGYFFLLWDEEAAEKYSLTSGKIDTKCKGLLEKYGIRSLCISREKKNIIFKHGFNT